MTQRIFYSWQKDLPNATNRSFIETALNKAIKEIKSQNKVVKDICLDRDTQSLPGSPNIVQTIFDKISNAFVFLADVSIINNNYDGRLTPNPNVMIELGYAIHCLSWSRIICVSNSAFGKVEELPFDIRQHRVIQYQLSNGDKDKAKQRKILTHQLQEALQAIINTYEHQNIKSAKFDIIDCNLGPSYSDNDTNWHWEFKARLYIAANNSSKKLTIPTYNIEVWIRLPEINDPIKFSRVNVSDKNQLRTSLINIDQATIVNIDATEIITGPIINKAKKSAVVTITTHPNDSNYPQSFDVEIPYTSEENDNMGYWTINRRNR